MKFKELFRTLFNILAHGLYVAGSVLFYSWSYYVHEFFGNDVSSYDRTPLLASATLNFVLFSHLSLMGLAALTVKVAMIRDRSGHTLHDEVVDGDNYRASSDCYGLKVRKGNYNQRTI